MKRSKIILAGLWTAFVFMSFYMMWGRTIFGNKTVGRQPDGSILVPSNQLLQPAGVQVYLPGRPVDLALSPHGNMLLVKNKNSLDLIRIRDRTVLQSLPYPHGGASLTGLCLSADGREVYVTDAGSHINIAGLDKGNVMHWKESIALTEAPAGGAPRRTEHRTALRVQADPEWRHDVREQPGAPR